MATWMTSPALLVFRLLELRCQLLDSRGQGIDNLPDLFTAYRQRWHHDQDITQGAEPDSQLPRMLADNRPGLTRRGKRFPLCRFRNQFHRGNHPALPDICHQGVLPKRLQAVFQVFDRGSKLLECLFLFKDLETGQRRCGGQRIASIGVSMEKGP